jgi:hypothetical protein
VSRKTPKTAVVAFKVEEELAEFLNQLPNKSAFIRKAIAAQMSIACPLCSGSGQVSRWLHDHYQGMLTMWRSQQCAGCGDTMSLPQDPGDLADAELIRLEQFFKGGPLYCDPCYDKAPKCGDCGWHIGEDLVEQHHHVHE